MTQKIKNILIENEYLNQANLDLEAENKELKQDLTLFKARCRNLASENWELKKEIADLKFTRNFLGVPMASEEVAIEAAENGYKPYNGDDF